jgi:hypothetical protein
MASGAERQRRHRAHRRGDHRYCNPEFCHASSSAATSSAPVEVPQTLYRFFDASGALLYVGITCDLPERVRRHRGEKAWWLDVANITVQHYADRQSVEEAEREAIERERPRWNVVYNVPAVRVAAPEPSSSLKVTLAAGEVSVVVEGAAGAAGLEQAALSLLIGALTVAQVSRGDVD